MPFTEPSNPFDTDVYRNGCCKRVSRSDRKHPGSQETSKVQSASLPYFAYAAAKTGDTLHVESVVEAKSRRANDFDLRLAQAFFAASHNHIAEARRLLDLALRVRPSTEYRPVLSEFQYAQALRMAVPRHTRSRLSRDAHRVG